MNSNYSVASGKFPCIEKLQADSSVEPRAYKYVRTDTSIIEFGFLWLCIGTITARQAHQFQREIRAIKATGDVGIYDGHQTKRWTVTQKQFQTIRAFIPLPREVEIDVRPKNIGDPRAIVLLRQKEPLNIFEQDRCVEWGGRRSGGINAVVGVRDFGNLEVN